MAISRIGLWSFDLAQLTQLQKALAYHPRQNTLSALQYSLQNVFDLGHYGLTLGWNQPNQFKYAAIVSQTFTCYQYSLTINIEKGFNEYYIHCGSRICHWVCTTPEGTSIPFR
jgi:hypothetical protein